MQTLDKPELSNVIQAILEVIGEPQNGWQQQAFDEYQEGDIVVKETAASNLNDYYCKCLGFLVAVKSSPNPPQKVLSSAARAAADHVHFLTLQKLGDRNAIAFKSQSPFEEVTESVLSVLSPITESEKQAISWFREGDFASVKGLDATDNHLLLSLRYLCSAVQPTPAFATVVAESCREAANHVRQRTFEELNRLVESAF